MPDTIPLVPTTATEVLLLLQVPPAGELLSVIFDPIQTLVAPVMADGELLTVTIADVEHPPLAT